MCLRAAKVIRQITRFPLRSREAKGIEGPGHQILKRNLVDFLEPVKPSSEYLSAPKLPMIAFDSF
jgi:hypothetical protein